MKTQTITKAFNRAIELRLIDSIKGQTVKDTDLKRCYEPI